MTTKCEAHSGHEARIINLEKSDMDQWKAIKSIQNRPPLAYSIVVTLILSALTFILGFVSKK